MTDRAEPDWVAPVLTDDVAGRAMVIAMAVRNAMEGRVHGGELGDLSLTDNQMALVNPVVRNAIATALHAEKHYFTDRAARAFLDFQDRLVPRLGRTRSRVDCRLVDGAADGRRCRWCGSRARSRRS